MKKNILIVDDEEFIVENLAALLEGVVDKAFTAFNGKEALEIIKSNDIVCIISDIKMPQMDGVELIKEVRALGDETPFIFFTAHGNDELMKEVAKHGAFDFIDKPDFQGLEEMITRGLVRGFDLAIKTEAKKKSSEQITKEYNDLLEKK